MSILDDFYNILKNSYNNRNFRDCVIVISKDGILNEEFLDERPYNHATLTCYMALKSGISYLETNNPLIAGRNLANNGVIAMQIHKDGICVCFFPDSITEVQFKVFQDRLMEFRDFYFQYDESMVEEGFVSFDNVLEYAKNIIDKDIKFLRK